MENLVDAIRWAPTDPALPCCLPTAQRNCILPGRVAKIRAAATLQRQDHTHPVGNIPTRTQTLNECAALTSPRCVYAKEAPPSVAGDRTPITVDEVLRQLMKSTSNVPANRSRLEVWEQGHEPSPP